MNSLCGQQNVSRAMDDRVIAGLGSLSDRFTRVSSVVTSTGSHSRIVHGLMYNTKPHDVPVATELPETSSGDPVQMHSEIEAEERKGCRAGSHVCNAAKRRKLIRQTPGPQKRRMQDRYRSIFVHLYTGEVRRKELFDLKEGYNHVTCHIYHAFRQELRKRDKVKGRE